jgi:hypothetical protein
MTTRNFFGGTFSLPCVDSLDEIDEDLSFDSRLKALDDEGFRMGFWGNNREDLVAVPEKIFKTLRLRPEKDRKIFFSDVRVRRRFALMDLWWSVMAIALMAIAWFILDHFWWYWGHIAP